MCKEGATLRNAATARKATAPDSPDSNSSKGSLDAMSPIDLTTGKKVPGKNEFHWSYTEEPHAIRRKQILAKYPEIKELYGHDPFMKYTTTFLVSLQITIATCFASQMNWWQFIVCSYVIGGTANHMLMLAIHELSHNLGFAKMQHNRLFSLFANLPIGVPSAISFKRYHIDHHKYQGEDGVDVDIPTAAEGRFFTNVLTKTVFIFLQVAFYALRPMIVNPKKPTIWEGINWVTALSFDFFILFNFGMPALGYLLLSSLLGSGMHPVAGHFIAEHYVFVKGHETYSYYGWLNIFAFNVGYHNEHHDFPFVSGRRLPQVRSIAAEFYQDLPVCESWPGVIYAYIMDPNVGAFSRVKRQKLDPDDLNRLKQQ